MVTTQPNSNMIEDYDTEHGEDGDDNGSNDPYRSLCSHQAAASRGCRWLPQSERADRGARDGEDGQDQLERGPDAVQRLDAPPRKKQRRQFQGEKGWFSTFRRFLNLPMFLSLSRPCLCFLLSVSYSGLSFFPCWHFTT